MNIKFGVEMKIEIQWSTMAIKTTNHQSFQTEKNESILVSINIL